MDNDFTFEFNFDINAIRRLKEVIDYAIKTWPGSPARPVGEQEFLWGMRDECNKCLMEYSFQNLHIDDK